ncbi:GNAT family N-acetyltransferase [Arenimonas sp. SCN 70-307]|uniref:GNAT family N-acetyltransferase n=1 Tax=Arenimonas sp. SCN 70-307 TaxID=1660089 RepID=UPI0025BD7D2F|nr:GNAT family N-acetyltransferase [Arenimonas sp. SCN 70-307]
MMAMDELRISDDPADVDLDVVHAFLSGQAYWSPGIPRALVEKAVANSLCFSAWLDGRQVGFARIAGDRATFGYLADVFVLPDYRGRGIARALVAAAMAHPEVRGLRRIMLATRDAHALYASFGFGPPSRPENLMEIHRPDLYRKG